MRIWHLVIALSLPLQCANGWGQSSAPPQIPTKRQLSGLSAEEATALLAKLKDAQHRLKADEFLTFELLAGSIASYDKTKISPREAFLQVPFDEVWAITRVRDDSSLWRRYRLSYSPNGLGQLYWDIEVALGLSGNIERVQMIYRPAAPF